MFRGSTLIYPIAKYPRENKLYFTALGVLINSTYKSKVNIHKKLKRKIRPNSSEVAELSEMSEVSEVSEMSDISESIVIPINGINQKIKLSSINAMTRVSIY